ncbi:hypothetical protein RJ639_004316 [Escallonia herrerae]|uniref:Retrotransposon gag domain-containing protein n=1 Tax=Escallonia herrerae TaxID=1293975 RepID=A0AA89AW18_9ASTE|nr:hypothetical protein RJ639_004316 [Escallonia herrerae]
MAGKYSLISRLTDLKDDWTIKARVTRMWDGINHNTNEVLSSNIIVLDQEENQNTSSRKCKSKVHIHATVQGRKCLLSLKREAFATERNIPTIVKNNIGNHVVPCNKNSATSQRPSSLSHLQIKLRPQIQVSGNPTFDSKEKGGEHMTRSGSCYRHDPSVKDSTNSSPKQVTRAETPRRSIHKKRASESRSQERDSWKVSDAVMCRAFPITLRKAAHAWFKSLQPRSIYSFGQLSDLFQKHFVSSRSRRKNSESLLNIMQEKNESLACFLGRFNAASLEIDNLDESVKYTALFRGLQPISKFSFFVNKSPPGNMKALLEKANKYIQAEEYLETHRGRHGEGKEEQKK